MNATVEEMERDNNYLLKTLEKTRQKLLDQTRRSRLLNYKEAARDIAVIDEMADIVFEDLVLNKKSFYFDFLKKEETETPELPLLSPQELDRTLPTTQSLRQGLDERYRDNKLQTPFSAKELERRLRRLYQEHRTMIEETGANSLFIVMGFLNWSNNENDSKPMKSPLMLVPVRLEREGTAGQAKYLLKFDDEAIDSNYSLIEKIRKEYDINLPQLDEEGKPETYWGDINKAIVRREVNGWHVVQEMALGLFRFNKQIMWHDLDPSRWPDHAPLVDKKVLKRILLGPKPGEPEPGQIFNEYPQDGDDVDTSLPPIKLIRDADSSQYSALIDSLTCDGGLVIEGPPGTGKSQTITNLIATALDQGLSVLFVAEKMAALEVVYKRLDEAGLGPFCLQLHGLKGSKKELLSDIAERMELRVSSPGSVQKEEKQLLQVRKELIEYSKALSKCVGPEDLLLYDIVWRIECLRQQLPAEIDDLALEVDLEVKFSEFSNIKIKLNDLGSEWSAIPEDARNAWAGYLPVNYQEKKESQLVDGLQSVITSLKGVEDFLFQCDVQATIPLLFEVSRLLALAKTAPGVSVKEIPLGVDSEIIRNIVTGDCLTEYQSLLKDVNEYLINVGKVNKAFDYSDELSNEYADRLASHSKKLGNIVLYSSVTINQLDTEVKEFQNVVDCLEYLPEDAKYALELLNKVARTVDDYSSIAEDAHELSNGPVELSLHSNVHHAKTSILNYLSQAKDKFSEIISRIEKLDYFVTTRVKSSAEVAEARDVIESKIGSMFAFFSGDYRKAKKKIKRLLKSPNDFSKSEEFVDKLNVLYDLSKDQEEFSNNVGFKTALGGLFVGMESNWQKLESLITFSQMLREKVGIEHATKILADWDAHLDSITILKDNVDVSVKTLNQFKNAHPFPESMWQRPISEISNTVKPWIEKIQFSSECLNQPWCQSTLSLDEAKKIANVYARAKQQERSIELLPGFSSLLRKKWDGPRTDILLLEQSDKWILDALAVPGMDIRILAWLFNEKGNLDRDKYVYFHSKIAPFNSAWLNSINILSQFGEVEDDRWIGEKTQTVGSLTEKLHLAKETISYLSLMQRWCQMSDNVKQLGFGVFSEYVSNGVLIDSQCGKAYEYILYKSLFEFHIKSNKLLADFSDVRYQSIRDRFAKLDRDIMKVNAKKISGKLANTKVSSGTGSGPVSSYSGKSLLRHEANKKTRHIPIRQLIRRSSSALKALKPCFLMSPLSVAQYLAPGDIHFDLVVMDEASQMRPEDALGAIARADTSIIVGDPKQLPPTNFFGSSVSDDGEEEDASILDDTEAILDVCLKQFPYRRLRWHYRSEHEALIQFSNDQFYEGDLIVFPSPKRESRDFGVHYNYIDNPSYKKGRNRKEAEEVVKNIIHHFRRHAKKSLGVAAFNKAQAEEISLILDKERQKDPAIDSIISDHNDEEPLFIKNLENVQGDERDVIFISTTYGPEEAGGPVAQRFGPINSDLGWRRLNVIATRAKQRVEIFSSMRPSDIRIGENAKRGVRALRDYIEYAATGKIPDRGIATGKEPDSEFEVAVIRLINNLGYECDPQVGVSGFFIDIGVKNPDRPGEYLMGIECDGATYHSSISMRDRDRLRQEILESKGWSIHRIWSTNWFHARSTEIERLKKVLQDQLEEDRKQYAASAETDFEEVPEVLEEASFATVQEIEHENEEDGLLLHEALDRFWEKNIRPVRSDQIRSILSEQMIDKLVNTRPINRDEWHQKIPLDLREAVHPDEGEFRQDIFDIVSEYS